ncbi:nucleotidyltransferase family protein [Bacillus sp. ISL-4]|uniref:nucleotidyltransferase family protein n=1 Tax=Bacillus sp. ISL-4 TaxID=2819125 RepID=UPI001BEB8D60|nr:nucleotidyltransferase family protein [Bacillus sp. ISL-4]MBT2664006.1 nucleotidyltransferase family protein [Bacillus sp. ISL-4]MBT2672605.1 nucleotidyltransferase family protein [Streptomyces sp. ISL-14]
MPKVGAIILAAGMSTRMGEPKLLLSLRGQPLFLHAIDSILGSHMQPIYLVAGKYIEEMRQHSEDYPELKIIHNPNYADGMSTSLKLGVQSIKEHVDAVMIFLADQPLISREIILSLIDKYIECKDEGVRIVRPKGEVGHPILVDAVLLNEFHSIDGDQGGKSIIKKYDAVTETVSFDNSMWGFDIDTPEDFQKVKLHLDSSCKTVDMK